MSQPYKPFWLTSSSWLLLSIVFLSAGCIAGTRALTGDQRSQLKRIAVIPMETPPLEIAPNLAVTLPAAASGLVLAPEPVGRGGMVLASVFGILMLADLPRASREAAANAESVERLLNSETRWSPSVVLADHLVTRLREGATREVTMVDTPREFPMVENRERTVMMRNWFVPIRDKWYNVDPSPIDYSDFAARGIDGILEVAVLGYSVTRQNSVAGDVFIKLSEPSRGAILARTRQYTLSCGQLSRPFDNGAQELKGAIAVCLRALGDQALKEIGLLTRP